MSTRPRWPPRSDALRLSEDMKYRRYKEGRLVYYSASSPHTHNHSGPNCEPPGADKGAYGCCSAVVTSRISPNDGSWSKPCWCHALSHSSSFSRVASADIAGPSEAWSTIAITAVDQANSARVHSDCLPRASSVFGRMSTKLLSVEMAHSNPTHVGGLSTIRRKRLSVKGGRPPNHRRVDSQLGNTTSSQSS